jgi:hypothetical protein
MNQALYAHMNNKRKMKKNVSACVFVLFIFFPFIDLEPVGLKGMFTKFLIILFKKQRLSWTQLVVLVIPVLRRLKQEHGV